MFRELYKKDNQLLSPSPELLQIISEKMRLESEKLNKPKWKSVLTINNTRQMVTLAASVCIIVAAAIIVPVIMNGSYFSKNEIIVNDSEPLQDIMAFDGEEAVVFQETPETSVFIESDDNKKADLFDMGDAVFIDENPDYSGDAYVKNIGDNQIVIPEGAYVAGETNIESFNDSSTGGSNEIANENPGRMNKIMLPDWNNYINVSSFTNWVSGEEWNNGSISNEPPDFLIIEDSTEDDNQENAIDEQQSYGENEEPRELTEDEESDQYDYDTVAGFTGALNILPSVSEVSCFNDFAEMFLSAEHRAVGVECSNEQQVSMMSLENIDTSQFYSFLSSCIGCEFLENSDFDSKNCYVKFIVATNEFEVYFKINEIDIMEISLSGYDGKYYILLDKGSFNKLWNLAESY